MARPLDAPEPSRWRDGVIVGGAALVLLIGLIVVTGMLAGGGSREPGTSADSGIAARPTAAATASVERSAGPAASDEPGSPPATGSPVSSNGHSASPSTQPTPAGTPTPTPVAGGAPTATSDFDLEGQVIPIAFPLLRKTHYQYRDNFLERREGPAHEYNHARTRDDETVVRLHDGIEIYAGENEPLVAVFSGTVIDPTQRWQPWERKRYGRTIAIVSDESPTVGYIALYAHADRVWVKPGTHVTRGQVLGSVGHTGDAQVESIRPHVHFELRAPFALDWSTLGEAREVDAFNPYGSLRAADPKRG
jgi:murein DD-endopeptidase MepM/ murein hydrolase activator NlpD